LDGDINSFALADADDALTQSDFDRGVAGAVERYLVKMFTARDASCTVTQLIATSTQRKSASESLATLVTRQSKSGRDWEC
jgi:hypothetical protein